jgi:hypothetical protein
MGDFGGIRATRDYDPSRDPKILRYEKFQQALLSFSQLISSESRAKQSREDRIHSLDIQSARDININVDAEEFLNNEDYRTTVKNKVRSKNLIMQKAKAWDPGVGQTVIGEVLSTFTSVLGDPSQGMIDFSDLEVVRRVLLEGRPQLNEIAIKDLTEEEIAGIPGLAAELSELGLWGEDAEGNDEEWDVVRKNLSDRLDWLVEGFQTQNKHYIGSELEAMQYHKERMLTEKSRKEYAESFEVVKEMRNADNAWTTKKVRLFPQDEEQEFIVDDTAYSWSEFQEDFRWSAATYQSDITELYDLKIDNPTRYQELIAGLSEENPAAAGTLSNILASYAEGQRIVKSMETQDSFNQIEFQKAARLRLESMEEAQLVIIPLAQEYAYLKLASQGLADAEGMSPAVIAKRMKDIEIGVAEYKNIQHNRFMNKEFHLRPDMIDDIWDKTAKKNFDLLLKDDGEETGYTEERREYEETVKDLDYNNIFKSLDLLGNY